MIPSYKNMSVEKIHVSDISASNASKSTSETKEIPGEKPLSARPTSVQSAISSFTDCSPISLDSALAKKITPLVEQFKEAKILVVGDAVLDENQYGFVSAVSDEAPISVMSVEKVLRNPGAAGNVAVNIARLGARSVSLAGLIGDDEKGMAMRSLLKQNGIKTDALLIDEKPTYSYTKIRGALDSMMTRTQELIRLDALPKGEMSKSVCAKLICAIERSIKQDKPNVIVFVDQCNYVVCDEVINHIQNICKGSTIVAASRFNITRFSKANVVVPNEAELRRSLGWTGGVSVAAMCKQLLARADGPHNAIVTQASRGLTVATLDGQLVSTGSLVSAADVVDVTGAGDSLIAAVACTLSVASSCDLLLAAMIGNVAAAVQVKKHGVCGVSRSELLLELQQHKPFGSSKVVSRQLLVNIVQQMRERDSTVTIGWTSGCFDLLHAAQVASLQASKALCDVLVVGVNSDVSVTALKGPTRPIVPHKQRAFLLASLAAVDFVVVFDENSPVDIMRALQPDVFCKGSDYNRGQLNKEECAVIAGAGGVVKIVDIPRQEGPEHTTDFVQKIKGLKL